MIDIILVFVSLIIGFSLNIFLFYLLTKKKPIFSFKSIIFLIISSSLMTFLNITNQTMLVTFGDLICTGFLITVWYDSDISEVIYYAIIIWLVTMIAEILVSSILVAVGFNYKMIRNQYLFRCLLLIPVMIIQILLTTIPIFKRIITKNYNKYFVKIQNNSFLSTFVFLLIYIFLILIYLGAYKSSSKILYYTTTTILCIILIVVILLIKYVIKSYELTIINKGIADENKLLKEISSKDAQFRHNLINNLLGIETVATKKAKLLIEELISSYESGYKNINNISKLPDGIDGLLYKKVYLRSINNLNLIVENSFIDNLLDQVSPRKYNLLIESFGILIDNALDAVEKCEEKIITINIEKNKDMICIEIKNNFNNIIDIENLGAKKYTTKLKGHGIGLNYILNNKKIEMKTKIVNNLYIAKMKMKIK